MSRRKTGQERDAESGLDYFGARYVSSAQGRFTSPDASNLGVDFYLPQTWNRYAYVGNNPFRYVDQNGLWWTEDLRVRNYSEYTVKNRRVHIAFSSTGVTSAASQSRWK